VLGSRRSSPSNGKKEHISTEPRINERIRVAEVRLVGPGGEQIGIVPIAQALQMARDHDLDLVEVSGDAHPPVTKLMDYGKYKYEAAQKARESRRNQANTVIKEMKLRPKIDDHDYETKTGHIVRFLRGGDKVKVTVMFRGREQYRPELGLNLLKRLAEDVAADGVVEQAPRQEGRNMHMVLTPTRKKAEARADQAVAREARMAEREAAAQADRSFEAEMRKAAAMAPVIPRKKRGPADNMDPDAQL